MVTRARAEVGGCRFDSPQLSKVYVNDHVVFFLNGSMPLSPNDFCFEQLGGWP